MEQREKDQIAIGCDEKSTKIEHSIERILSSKLPLILLLILIIFSPMPAFPAKQIVSCNIRFHTRLEVKVVQD